MNKRPPEIAAVRLGEYNLNPITKQFQFGDQQVSIETNKIAKQATGSVVVTIGDTVVLTTVVGAKSARPGQDFFPLTVNYQEKTYAAGKIPGGFFRREGPVSYTHLTLPTSG